MARVRRLHPDPAEFEPETFLAGIELADGARGERPHVAVNMVVSVDGRAAAGGRSAPLTSPFDRALFHALRGRTDCVLVGTRTLSAERYGPLVRDPERQRARVERGLPPAPLACVVTRSGDLDLSVPLFDDPASRVVVFTGGEPADVDCRADVRLVSLPPAELEPGAVMRALRADHGVESVLCEGGPTLNAALLRAGVVDELFLSVAPTLVGGHDPLALVCGDAGAPTPFALRWMLEAGGTVFLRYGVRRASDAP